MPRAVCIISPGWKSNVKNSRTDEVISSFALDTVVFTPAWLSPDGERIGMFVAEDSRGCGSKRENPRLSVYTKGGEQLYRNAGNPFVDFDWHPDGRLIVLQKVPNQDRDFQILVETAPGSYEFAFRFQFTAPPGVLSYYGLTPSIDKGVNAQSVNK